MPPRIALDANVVLRAFYPPDPRHEQLRSVMGKLLDGGWEVLYTPQVVREICHTCMRPPVGNGLGLDFDETRRILRKINASALGLLDDEPGIYERWLGFMHGIEVRGRQVHDANLAASLAFHGVTHLLSLDRRDFARYPGLLVVTPERVLNEDL